MKQPITMVRGTTQTISINLADATGAAYVLAEGDVLRFGVKKCPTDKQCLLIKELTSANADENTAGLYVLNLSPADTEPLDPGYHFYDVGLQIGTEYINVIECSKFELLPNITSREVAE